MPGVGEKTAAKLINDHGSLDEVFAHLDQCTPKLRESLAAHEDQVYRNAMMTPLVRDVPVDAAIDDLRMGEWDGEATRQLFNFLEFRTLWDRLVEAIGEGTAEPAAALPVVSATVVRPTSTADAVGRIDALAGAGRLAIDAAWEGQPGRSPILGLALLGVSPVAPAAGDLPSGAEPSRAETSQAGTPEVLWVEADLLSDAAVAAALRGAFEGAPVAAHRAKELIRGLAGEDPPLDLPNLEMDPAVAAYLLDPAEGQYLLEDVARRFAEVELAPPGDAVPGQLDLSGEGPTRRSRRPTGRRRWRR